MQTIQKRSERNMNNKLEVIGIDHKKKEASKEKSKTYKAKVAGIGSESTGQIYSKKHS